MKLRRPNFDDTDPPPGSKRSTVCFSSGPWHEVEDEPLQNRWLAMNSKDFLCLLFLTEDLGTQVRMLGHQANWDIQNVEITHTFERCHSFFASRKAWKLLVFLEKWVDLNSSPFIPLYIYISLYRETMGNLCCPVVPHFFWTEGCPEEVGTTSAAKDSWTLLAWFWICIRWIYPLVI